MLERPIEGFENRKRRGTGERKIEGGEKKNDRGKRERERERERERALKYQMQVRGSVFIAEGNTIAVLD